MRIPIQRLQDYVWRKVVRGRNPDQVIGGPQEPYLSRWYLVPKNRLLNVYIHFLHRGDDDRALHDHPWSNLSLVLCGEYTEHRIQAGGIHQSYIRKEGEFCFRPSGKLAHRIELHAGGCITLFITGPKYREWGFHCPEAGWIHWRKFVAEDDHNTTGKGCNQ
jgi:hypothetical protein